MDKRSFGKLLPLLMSVAAGVLLGALGYCALTFLSCFMDGDPSRYPVTFPVSILGGIGCAAVLAVLIWRYIALRKKYPSPVMVAVEIILALTLALPCLLAWGKLAQL